MRVFVTGINGFVARRFARALRDAGHEVRGTVRALDRLPTDLAGIEAVEWRLDRPLPAAAMRGCDVAVHAAYSPDRNANETNLAGTRTALAAARSAGVGRQVFLSSFSATPDATSTYGRMKHELEQEFGGEGMSIVRPGLVAGPGGMFAKMVGSVRRLPVVPLPGGGRRPVPLIGSDDLASCLLQIVTADRAPASINLCYAERPPLRELLRTIAHALNKPKKSNAR